MNQEDIDRILAENLKLMRGYNYLKKEVILLRAEREDREKRVKQLETNFSILSSRFYSIERSDENIKSMQDYISFQNGEITEKFKKLEEIVLESEKTKMEQLRF